MVRKFFLLSLMILCSGCFSYERTTDDLQRAQQETLLAEGTAETGMPAIKNFRERKIVKDIIEMRDQNLTTYTYLYSEMTGKLIFFGESVGYGIPYSTQYTSPEKFDRRVFKDLYGESQHEVAGTVPQADPNGLFSPSSAEGTWVLIKDPNGTEIKPVYVEPKIIVSPFKLPTG